MKLTKIQKITRFAVYTIYYAFVMSLITGLLPAFIAGNLFKIFGL